MIIIIYRIRSNKHLALHIGQNGSPLNVFSKVFLLDV